MKPLALVVLLIIICIGCAKRDFFEPTPLAYPHESTNRLADADSITVQAGKHYARGRFLSFVFGKHYRDVWATPIQVKVLRLNQENGGLQIEKVGGSMQSTSFTLRDKNGLEYALRTVDKDPAGSLPAALQNSLIANFMRDQTAALNPYAALVVSHLANAAGIPHANPRLFYLPTDSTILGKYTSLAGDRLYMLEEKMEHKRVLSGDTSKLDDIVSTKKLLKKRFNESDHRVDQVAFAKARLFDIYINDRDRHQGQWNWAKYKKGGQNLYKPIPKDRDQAFYRFADGVLPFIVGRGLRFQKFISFRDDFDDLEALTFKSEYIDQHFLTEVTQVTFDSLAKELQTSLTDSVIEHATKALPKEIYELVGARLISTLKSRRNLLPEAAKAYYKLLAKKVIIAGSDEEDHFVVKRLDNERTEVVLRHAKSEKLLYHRIFYRNETDEIELYGLKGDDLFEVSGKVGKGIKITLTGGLGEDEIIDESEVKGWRKMTIVRDTARGTKLTSGPETKNKTTTAVTVHAFDREGV
jgi:hypothetical protein